MQRFLQWAVPSALVMMSGCPFEQQLPEGVGGAGGQRTWATAGAGGGQLEDEIARLLAAAQAQTPPFSAGPTKGRDLPPFPGTETLCMLRFNEDDDDRKTGMSIDEVKTLFGTTDQESQSISDASLVYRFSCGGSDDLLCGISLSFMWLGENWFATEGKYDNYYLSAADVRGAPRPLCWPHVDTTDD